MARIIVVYGTTEGHTRKIAERIGDWIRNAAHGAVVLDGATAFPGVFEEGEYDGAVLCGSVHQGKHSSSLVHLVKQNRDGLERIPTVFLSVSLAAAVADAGFQGEAASYVDDFVQETGWHPGSVKLVAGALLYTQYDFMKRMMMRLIANSRGGDADTSQDWEYTDWTDLRAFVEDFLRQLATRSEALPTAAESGVEL
jgi:menaquinone-dependent protoporphyrinogen oxidase